MTANDRAWAGFHREMAEYHDGRAARLRRCLAAPPAYAYSSSMRAETRRWIAEHESAAAGYRAKAADREARR